MSLAPPENTSSIPEGEFPLQRLVFRTLVRFGLKETLTPRRTAAAGGPAGAALVPVVGRGDRLPVHRHVH